MTEVPDYLLQRSRERRAALGLESGDAPAGDTAPVPAAAAPVATQAATPVPASTPEIEIAEPPRPIPPWVEASASRKKIPAWMAPVALFLPIWGFMIWGTLEEPTRPAAGPIAEGAEVYSQCSACHGAGGGGGVGYQLNDGQVLLTFPDVESHIAWVVNGSPATGTPYGDPARAGGQRVAGALGAVMPDFAALTSEQVLAVVLYERSAHGLAAEAELEPYILWAEHGELPEWETGVTTQAIAGEFADYLATDPAAQEALQVAQESAATAGG